MKGEDILDLLKEGGIEKGVVDLEQGMYNDPPYTNYIHRPP